MTRMSRLMLAALVLLLVCSMAGAAGNMFQSSAQRATKTDTGVQPIPASQAPVVRSTPKAWMTLHTQDFETAMAPWTHTNGLAFPAAWDRQVYNVNLHDAWACPSSGSWSLWIDSDADGGLVTDDAWSPAIATSGYDTIKAVFARSFNFYSAPENFQVLHRTFSTGAWSSWTVDRSYVVDVLPGWDSISVIGPIDSFQLGFYYTGDYGWYAAVDNITITGFQSPMGLDVKPVSIDTPATAFVLPSVIFHGVWTIQNVGTDPTSDFTTHYNIYDSTGALLYGPSGSIITPDTLFPDSIHQFFGIADFTPDPMMWYQVEAITELAGDLRPENDTLRFNFRTFDEVVGSVTDDNNAGAPLAGVAITATGPDTFNTTTDGSGDYFFFDMPGGTYDFTAVLAGYSTETVTGVTINDNMQTTQNIAMGFPVLSYGPMDSLYVSLVWDTADSTTWDITLNNTGTRDLHYNLSWPETTLVKGASKAPVSLILDDGSRENDIGIGGASAFMFLNRFTPGATEFPFFLNEVQVYFVGATGSNVVGDPINIVIYENTSGSTDPAVGSNWLYSYQTTLQVVDAWNSYVLPAPVLFNGPGDVLIGVIALKTPGTAYYPASIDQTTTQQRSWAGWWSTPAPPSTEPTLPPDGTWVLIDDYFPGNWMVRGSGASANAPWLDISPYSGTIGASNGHNLNVTFNSAGYDSFTTWGANVKITSDGAIAKAQYTVPAYMHVLGMTGVEGKPIDPSKPVVFALNASYPNPSPGGNADFKFALPKDSRVSISVYNVSGQKVKTLINTNLNAGYHSVNWNGKNDNGQKVSAGVYLYQMQAEGFSATRKMVILR